MKRRFLSFLLIALLCVQGMALADAPSSVTGAYRIGEFHDGLALLCTMHDFRYGLMDADGAITVEPQWDGAVWLTDELIAMYTYDSGWYGVVDRDGHYVSDTKWDRIERARGCTLLWQGDAFAVLNDEGRQITDVAFTAFIGQTASICLLKDPDGLYAYVDLSAGELGTQRWNKAQLFYNGFAAVSDGSGWNYLLPSGKTLLTTPYASVGRFEAGQAVCADKAGNTFLIDESGAVLKTQTDYAADTVDASPYFDDELGAYGYRSAAGATVIEPRFREAVAFQNGLARVKYREGWGFVNAEGDLVLANAWLTAQDFVGRYAYVEDELYHGYIDPDGRLFSAYPLLGKTLANADLLVMDIDGKQYLADADMRPKTTTGYATIEEVSGQTIIVSDAYENESATTVYGLIDFTGKAIILPQWNSLDAFTDGLSRVSLNGLYGLIDPSGTVIAKPVWNLLDNTQAAPYPVFAGVLSADATPLKGKYNFLLADGTTLSKSGWDYAEAFSDGLALIYTGDVDELTGKPTEGKYGYVDTTGVVVMEPAWQLANSFSGGVAAVSLDGVWSVIDTDGTPRF